jgi:predicted  nucleic acid-binding Zn-ribbon protein
MPKRTIAQARDQLDRLTISPDRRREYERILSRHVKREVARVHTNQMEGYRNLDAEVTDVKQALGDVERGLNDLDRQSRSRDLTASEYRKQFDDLQGERQRLLQRAMSLQAQVDKLAEVEEDPEAYLDSLYERYPTIRPEFPW